MPDCRLELIAEDALLVRFGESIDAAINARVHTAAHALRDAGLPGISDIAPAYASVLVRFDPLASDARSGRLREAIGEILDHGAHDDNPSHRHAAGAAVRPLDIPVCYGGDCGADLDAVAKRTGLSCDEIITRHADREYTVAMLGFAPGFPYLLGLDPVLHVPRRANPRTRVPAGSIAIGGAQTGIYPRALPGGWNLIGRTPLVLFDPAREHPCLLAPGDRVRFHPIDDAEFARLGKPDA